MGEVKGFTSSARFEIPVTSSRAHFGGVLFSSLVHELETERTAGRNPAIMTELKKNIGKAQQDKWKIGKAIGGNAPPPDYR